MEHCHVRDPFKGRDAQADEQHTVAPDASLVDRLAEGIRFMTGIRTLTPAEIEAFSRQEFSTLNRGHEVADDVLYRALLRSYHEGHNGFILHRGLAPPVNPIELLGSKERPFRVMLTTIVKNRYKLEYADVEVCGSVHNDFLHSAAYSTVRIRGPAVATITYGAHHTRFTFHDLPEGFEGYNDHWYSDKPKECTFIVPALHLEQAQKVLADTTNRVLPLEDVQ